MKKLSSLLAGCILFISCQQDVQENYQQTTSTRDSLIGHWDMQYTFIQTFSDSTYSTIIDSFFYGETTPYSFLVLNNDSSQQQFFSDRPTPPIYGFGASGRWRYESARRLIWMSHEVYSSDTGWTNTSPHPPPNDLIPMYWINYLGSDSLAVYIQGRRDNPPASYRRIYDIFKRRR